MKEQISIMALLSQGRARPPVFGPEEKRVQPPASANADFEETTTKRLSLSLQERYKPTREMLDLCKEIEKARLQVTRAYERMLAKSEPPTTRALTKFRELVSEAEFLANRYLDIELAARRAHEARREEMSRTLAQHEERGARPPLKVPIEELGANRLVRFAVQGPEGMADALAEGEISPKEFRMLKRRLFTPPTKPLAQEARASCAS